MVQKNLPPFMTTVTPFSKLLAFILFITLPFIGFCLGIKYNLESNIPSHTVNVPKSTSIPSSVKVSPNPKNLVRISSGNKQVITTFDNESADKILRWKNWLFYQNLNSTTQKLELVGHDTVSGTSVVLFELDSVGENNIDGDIDPYTLDNLNLYLLSDTLLFSVDGRTRNSFDQGGGVYYLKLPPVAGSSQKLSGPQRGELYSVGGRLWLVDARVYGMCEADSDYWLIDPYLFSAKHVLLSDESCWGGESVVNFDLQGNLITQTHSYRQPISFPEGESFITKLSIINPINNSTNTLLSASTMPKGVVFVSYSNTMNQISLFTSSTQIDYLFDLGYHKLIKSLILTEDFSIQNTKPYLNLYKNEPLVLPFAYTLE